MKKLKEYKVELKKKKSLGHIIFKFKKNRYKQKIMKEAREENLIYRGTRITTTVNKNISSATIQAREY